jgi:hypothetical protein
VALRWIKETGAGFFPNTAALPCPYYCYQFSSKGHSHLAHAALSKQYRESLIDEFKTSVPFVTGVTFGVQGGNPHTPIIFFSTKEYFFVTDLKSGQIKKNIFLKRLFGWCKEKEMKNMRYAENRYLSSNTYGRFCPQAY